MKRILLLVGMIYSSPVVYAMDSAIQSTPGTTVVTVKTTLEQLQTAVTQHDLAKVGQLLEKLKEESSGTAGALLDSLTIAEQTATAYQEKINQKITETPLFQKYIATRGSKALTGVVLSIFGAYSIGNAIYVPASGDAAAKIEWPTSTSGLLNGVGSLGAGSAFIYSAATGKDTGQTLAEINTILAQIAAAKTTTIAQEKMKVAADGATERKSRKSNIKKKEKRHITGTVAPVSSDNSDNDAVV